MSYRIILTVNYSPWSAYSGGGQWATHHLARALAGRGHRVDVVFTKPPWERIDIPDDLPYTAHFAGFFGLRSRCRAIGRPLNGITVRRLVARLLNDDEVGVVHCQGEEGVFLDRLRPRKKFAFIVSPRYPSYPSPLQSDRSNRVQRGITYLFGAKYFALGRALHRADLIVPTSHHAASMVQRVFGIDPRQCTVSANGINEIFCTIRRRPPAADAPVLFYGRLEKEKGADLLLTALHRLGNRRPPAVIIGRGREEKGLQAQAHRLRLDREVRFIDWQPPHKLADYLSQAAMAVLPSREESFGNAIAEAMAAGVPVITSRCGSIPELIDNGRTGLLVDPGATEQIAGAIDSLYRHPNLAADLGRRARERARQDFSWDAAAARLETLYSRVVAMKGYPREGDGK